MSDDKPQRQLLHLVFGGELVDPASIEFVDLEKVHVVGVFPNYAEAYAAWRGATGATVDDAHMRYFIVHLHKLMDPAHERERAKLAGHPVDET